MNSSYWALLTWTVLGVISSQLFAPMGSIVAAVMTPALYWLFSKTFRMKDLAKVYAAFMTGSTAAILFVLWAAQSLGSKEIRALGPYLLLISLFYWASYFYHLGMMKYAIPKSRDIS